MFRLSLEHNRDRQKSRFCARARRRLKKRPARISATLFLTGSAHRRSNHPRPGDDSILILHSTMRSIIPSILAARVLPQVEEPLSLLNLKTNDGILITRPRVYIPRCPNHRSAGAKGSIAWLAGKRHKRLRLHRATNGSRMSKSVITITGKPLQS